jgi:hypothetical protein
VKLSHRYIADRFLPDKVGAFWGGLGGRKVGAEAKPALWQSSLRPRAPSAHTRAPLLPSPRPST